MRITKKIAAAAAGILLIGLYTGGWFYVESKLENVARKKLEILQKSSASVRYGKLTKAGYPFSFGINITDFSFFSSSRSKDQQITVDKLLLRSNLMGSDLSLTLEGDVRIAEPGREKENVRLRFPTPPVVSLHLNRPLSTYNMQHIEELWSMISSLGYQDKGYVIEDEQTKTVLSKGDHMRITVHVEDMNGKKQVIISGKVEGVEHDTMLKKHGVTTLPGKTEGTLEALFTLNDKGEQTLELKEFSLIAERMRTLWKGSLSSGPSQLIPSGELQVMLGNYTQIIDYMSENDVLAKNKSAIVKTMLEKAAGGGRAADLNITIKSDKGRIHIGALPLEEVIAMYQGEHRAVPSSMQTMESPAGESKEGDKPAAVNGTAPTAPKAPASPSTPATPKAPNAPNLR